MLFKNASNITHFDQKTTPVLKVQGLSFIVSYFTQTLDPRLISSGMTCVYQPAPFPEGCRFHGYLRFLVAFFLAAGFLAAFFLVPPRTILAQEISPCLSMK